MWRSDEQDEDDQTMQITRREKEIFFKIMDDHIEKQKGQCVSPGQSDFKGEGKNLREGIKPYKAKNTRRVTLETFGFPSESFSLETLEAIGKHLIKFRRRLHSAISASVVGENLNCIQINSFSVQAAKKVTFSVRL